jgi:hypothetical protein
MKRSRFNRAKTKSNFAEEEEEENDKLNDSLRIHSPLLHEVAPYLHSSLQNEDFLQKTDKKTVKKLSKAYLTTLQQRFNLPEPGRITPPEFTEMRHYINDLREVPRSEMIRDIRIGEKADLERIKDYSDGLPFLKFRKKLAILRA